MWRFECILNCSITSHLTHGLNHNHWICECSIVHEMLCMQVAIKKYAHVSKATGFAAKIFGGLDVEEAGLKIDV